MAMIPVEGASEEQPALFVIEDDDGEAVVILADELAESTGSVPETEAAEGETATPAAPAIRAVALPVQAAGGARAGRTQALAVGTRDGAITYKVATPSSRSGTGRP